MANIGMMLGAGKFTERSSGGGASLLLDLITEVPTVVYALQKLKSDWTGSLIRIREDGGNTELDIGMDGNSLDVAAIASHCGANKGKVVKLYDKSGSGFHASQSTASLQPEIWDGSAIVTFQSQIAMKFTSGQQFLTATGAINGGTYTSFGALARCGFAANPADRQHMLWKNTEYTALSPRPGVGWYFVTPVTTALRYAGSGLGYGNNLWHNYLLDWDGATQSLYVNNVAGTTASSSGTQSESATVLYIGDNYTASPGYDQYLSNIIITYNEQFSADSRQEIEDFTWE